ncbi:hypothetical protein V495_01701 [Pseudogymnoascus sp. VKM F-4514 (FW-929)]|nr:hypothetical protein V495_01701 [Pseudogymnoascus sp. VKM F-4514 (FW-929)]KFY56298.1 hypothetical protein V497_06369 [Pseudogymnoascus sp. VKM F-4516 (FW-969)]
MEWPRWSRDDLADADRGISVQRGGAALSGQNIIGSELSASIEAQPDNTHATREENHAGVSPENHAGVSPENHAGVSPDNVHATRDENHAGRGERS